MHKYIFILLAVMISLNSSTKFDSRVISGKELDSIDEKEYMVGIGELINDSLFAQQCGGALIDSLHVVTAAHCVVKGDMYIFAKYHIMPDKQFEGKDLNSLTKEQILSQQKGILVKASRAYTHNDFKFDKVSDIALIKLEKPIEISTYAKLPTTGTTNPLLQKNQSLELLGWGLTDGIDLQPSNKLKSINIKALTPKQCARNSANDIVSRDSLAPLSNETIDKVLCAGGLAVQQENQGACKGDSGGPLVYKSSNGPILIGVVSTGAGPCTAKSSGQFTKVEKFLDFIKQAKDGAYTNAGSIKKEHIQNLPSGFNLLGTTQDITSDTKIFSDKIQLIYVYDTKNKKWQQYNINNGVAPANLNIPAKSGFWIQKQ